MVVPTNKDNLKYSDLGILLGLAASSAWGQSYTISTFAGGGLPALPASALSISAGSYPGVAVDGAGNLYIADNLTNAVYKVSPAGSLTVVAGTGRPGYSGDLGPATSAQLSAPTAVAVDGSGVLYIGDTGNSRVRKVSGGVITTLVGNGAHGYSGDGGLATDAEITGASGITFDSSGDVYIADEFNYVVRKISSAGIITTIAGNGTFGYSGDSGPAVNAQLSYPYGLAIDTSGNLYVADENNSVIRRVSAAGVISTIAGTGVSGNSGDGGPAVNAQLNNPQGLTIDVAGNLYFADFLNERVRKISATGTIGTIAGNGSFGFSGDGGLAISAALENPENVAVSSGGSIYLTDALNFRVREISNSGIIMTVAGNGFESYSGSNEPALEEQFAYPQGAAVDVAGNVFISDTANHLIRKVSGTGIVTTIAGNGISGYSGDNGPAVNAQIGSPFGLTVDSGGDLYFADNTISVVRKVGPNGIIATVAGNGAYGYYGDGGPATGAALNQPEDVAVDGSGNIYIADGSNQVIRRVTPEGTITTFAGNGTAGYGGDGGPAVSAELSYPSGVAVDAGGNILIVDAGNERIREVSYATGVITTFAGTGAYGPSGDGGLAINAALGGPSRVAVDESGNVYIAGTNSNLIRKVSTSGIITSIAGTGVSGYSGDNGPALAAQIYGPIGIAAARGVVYFTDTLDNVIRELTQCPLTVASVSADSNAQTVSSSVTAGAGCEWSAANLPAWVNSATNGTGTGTLALTFQANTTGADRSAVISVNGLPFTVTQAFTAAAFSDVLPGNYYFDAVNLLKAKNITAGCGGTDYCPSAVVTRDDMAIFIVRTILGTDTFSYSSTPYFADVPSTYFAFKWIQKLYELGVTAGCSASPLSYCPGTVVTRDQMAIFIIRARYGATTAFTWNPTAYFADVPSGYFAFDWVQRLYQDGITAGCASSPLEYCPGNAVIRGDMAIFLMRGGFNQLIPSTEPVVSSIVPTTLAHGTTGTFTITGVNTTFQQGVTQLVFAASSGVTVNAITVTSPTSMQVSLTAAGGAPLERVSIYEQTEPQEAVLPNGLTIQ